MTVYKGQAFLVAVVPSRQAFALAAEGEQAGQDLAYFGSDLEALGFDPEDFPEKVGIYVWEGAQVLTPQGQSDLEDWDVEWEGAWRPAALPDFARSGLPVPGPG